MGRATVTREMIRRVARARGSPGAQHRTRRARTSPRGSSGPAEGHLVHRRSRGGTATRRNSRHRQRSGTGTVPWPPCLSRLYRRRSAKALGETRISDRRDSIGVVALAKAIRRSGESSDWGRDGSVSRRHAHIRFNGFGGVGPGFVVATMACRTYGLRACTRCGAVAGPSRRSGASRTCVLRLEGLAIG